MYLYVPPWPFVFYYGEAYTQDPPPRGRLHGLSPP